MTPDQEAKCRKAFEEWHLEEHGFRECKAFDNCYDAFEEGWLACQKHNDDVQTIDDVKCDSGSQDHQKICAKLKAAEEMAKELSYFVKTPPSLEQWRKANE